MIPWRFFLWAGAVSFALSLGISAALAPRAKRVVTKKGRRVPPELGGVILFFTLALTFLLFFVLYSVNVGDLGRDQRKLFGIAIGAAGAFLLGFLDDHKGLHYSAKLTGQIFAASVIPLSGFELDFMTVLGGGLLRLPDAVGSVVIVGWIVFMMNAVNLIDGLDGLASGVVAMAAATIFLLGWPGNPLIASGAVVLAAALIGILPFNSYPAKFYLGDSGSLLIGFLIGVYSLFFHVKTYIAIVILIPLLILFIPVLNTVSVIAIRLKRGRNPLKGDIFHLHYRLLRQGLSHRATVFFLWVVTGSLSLLVILRQFLPFRHRTAVFLIAILAVYSILVQFFLGFLKRRRAARRKQPG
jgi:UDP-GlcNAc:undecaprenyl-phosphate GlcNAc-1-phosphate transferase